MIFVTVGTHEQQFNRLIQCIDELKEKQMITDDVIMQTGYSTYSPKYCEWKAFMPYKEMQQNIAQADIVITHGGPASFIAPLQVGKVPIVVPRQKKYDEHVNDHQVEFSHAVSERMGNIIVINEVEDLMETIKNYNTIVSKMQSGITNHNDEFNRKFAEIVEELF